ncbi:MAG TPA: pyridoxamine 5'-phosphate oxidase family protein [Herpetosiphonaceae bacterium]|nr:pyridoxamine 5'-phosphate oxidase family protein [Herpetosiphonaceae bacterium]
MARTYPEITDELRTFIEAQHMFFVASAPLAAEGHVNVSPKGLDCLRVLGPLRVAYLDLTGSGNETSAHLQENGRVTLM